MRYYFHKKCAIMNCRLTCFLTCPRRSLWWGWQLPYTRLGAKVFCLG